MKKKILIVEDDGNIYKMLEKELGSSFQLERARAVDEAIGKVKRKGPFACFVVDLQIPPIGLTLDEIIQFENFEGYALLKKRLWKGTEEDIEKLKSKTIICSRYVSNFKEKYGDEIKGLKMVNKAEGFEKKVASFIEELCNE